MAGKSENNRHCALCGGRLKPKINAVPFVFEDSVIVVKGVPAEVCGNCHEPYLAGSVTDEVTDLLNRVLALNTEVSIVSYGDRQISAESD